MSKMALSKPVNPTQEEFKRLCELGGGTSGGPVHHKVLELLRASGKRLNAVAYRETAEHLKACPGANPWHVCFSVGLCWGHLAKFEVEFTVTVVGLLADWNETDLKTARPSLPT